MSLVCEEATHKDFIQLRLTSKTFIPEELKQAWDRVRTFLSIELLMELDPSKLDCYTDGISTFVFRFRDENLRIYEEKKDQLNMYVKLFRIDKKYKQQTEKSKEDAKQGKAIKVFTDKRELARLFIKIQPLFYDEGKNFWLWNFDRNTWELRDDVHILNMISDASHADTISSKEKNEILEALKQVGRRNSPKKMPKTWIQFKNVLVDIKTKETYESSPEHFCTNPIPWSIGIDSATPNIDKIFEEWVGKEYVQTLKEIAAYCLLSDYPIHRIFCFLGSGRNGKSKYLQFVERLIGEDNVTSVDLDTLMQSRFEMFNLYKKLAVQMGETNFSTMSRTATLKKLTGQDKVSFEAKNKDPIADVNYAKLLISTNNLPDTDDKTDGFFRRWLCVDFPNEFAEGKEVLDRIPQEEYNNFCTASVDILAELLKNGSFTNEGTVAERQERYEERSNPFDKFVKEECDEFDDGFVFKHEFKKEYAEWCKKNRFRPPTDMEISKKMKAHSFAEGKEKSNNYDKDRGEYKRYRAWRGLVWKNSGLSKDFVEEVILNDKGNTTLNKNIQGIKEERI